MREFTFKTLCIELLDVEQKATYVHYRVLCSIDKLFKALQCNVKILGFRVRFWCRVEDCFQGT